ncbi:MAG: NifU family protein [bacterium]|nr:NifU family protein [bacterium]
MTIKKDIRARTVSSGAGKKSTKPTKKKTTKQIIAAVEAVLKEFEPMFTEHGGGAELVAVESDSVILRLVGNCQGCGLADLHFGVSMDEKIKKVLPQIREITYSY